MCSHTILSDCDSNLIAARHYIQAIKFSPLRGIRARTRARIKSNSEKRADINTLKKSGLFPFIQNIIGDNRQFTAEQIDSITNQLNAAFPFGGWRWEILIDASSIGAVLFAKSGVAVPGLVFCANEKGFALCAFHFDLSSKKGLIPITK